MTDDREPDEVLSSYKAECYSFDAQELADTLVAAMNAASEHGEFAPYLCLGKGTFYFGAMIAEVQVVRSYSTGESNVEVRLVPAA